MPDEPDVWSGTAPWIHRVDDGSATRPHWPLPPPGTCYVAHLDGARMRDSQGVFEEFARALRFPVHFGWNWAAFHECVRDLSWMPSRHYLVVVADAGQLLADEPDELKLFLGLMDGTGRSWSRRPDRPAVAFNLLLIR
ncbi:barstar family protein [Kitasatospora sp. NBC_00315]|uniref:barstar family protein n=1 Tax=Kitasatospora sp. NBC_00315 TaxID=2975963 RepID=UPI0032438BCE